MKSFKIDHYNLGQKNYYLKIKIKNYYLPQRKVTKGTSCLAPVAQIGSTSSWGRENLFIFCNFLLDALFGQTNFGNEKIKTAPIIVAPPKVKWVCDTFQIFNEVLLLSKFRHQVLPKVWAAKSRNLSLWKILEWDPEQYFFKMLLYPDQFLLEFSPPNSKHPNPNSPGLSEDSSFHRLI